jgi:cellulose synthase/poly-beta-1,6-N-acetylglucosamine synthase-like glycosyltransferase
MPALVLVIIAAIATVLLTLEGAWIIYTTREDREAILQMLKPSFVHKKRKICVIFPAYKDVVRLDRWLEWGPTKEVTYMIVEDETRNNEKLKENAIYLHRDKRAGFKAGAVNYCFDYMVKKGMDFDYVIVVDADHIPFNDSVQEIYGYLYNPIIQFFWYDGLPMDGLVGWMTYSARYFSNWNIYNRRFPNLTGNGIAISYDLVKSGLRFPESITEDYALTLQSMHGQWIRITVVPFVLCIGYSPSGFKPYVKQQIRWAEGTIREGRTYFFKTLNHEVLSLYDKWDFIMQINLYLQGVYLLVTIALLFLNLSLGIILLPLIVFQGVAYFKLLSKTPKRYWLIYFIMNYIMAFVQTYALLRAAFVSKGTFVTTDKSK